MNFTFFPCVFRFTVTIANFYNDFVHFCKIKEVHRLLSKQPSVPTYLSISLLYTGCNSIYLHICSRKASVNLSLVQIIRRCVVSCWHAASSNRKPKSFHSQFHPHLFDMSATSHLGRRRSSCICLCLCSRVSHQVSSA